jgi:acyl-coenzyme A synthetase/AMP-(fatty) acid ligase
MRLPGLLSRHDATALVASGPGARTAAALLRDADAIGAVLADAVPGDLAGKEVVLVADDRAIFAAALLACTMRGAVVALPPSAQPEMVREVRHREGVVTVLHDRTGMLGLDLRAIVDRAASESPVMRALVPLAPEAPIVVVYTSGTTGTPLRCPKTAGQLVGEADTLRAMFRVAPGTPILPTVPPHHVYGLLFGVLLPLVSGGSFPCETLMHGEPLAALATRDRSRVLVSVPAHLRALRTLPAGGLPRFERVFSSAAPLPRETWDDLSARFGWRVTEALGSSETGGIAYREHPDAPWTPFDGVSVDVDADGRMLVDSPFVDPSAPRPFTTGDRIERVGTTGFRHLGRADGVIKIAGTRISIAEVEHRLLAVPGIEDAAVIAVDVDGLRGTELWAVIVSQTHTDARAVRQALLPHLEPVVIPRRVRVVDALPRDGSGKVRRAALRALFE